MAETALVLTQGPKPNTLTSIIHPNDSTIINHNDSNSTTADDEIPTIDDFMLFSDDPDQRSNALEYLGKVCQDYGFFYLVNHGVPDSVIEGALGGISEFFYLTEEEKREYGTKNPTDRIRWGLGFAPGDHDVVKREYFKVVPHPKCRPAKPADFSEALEQYCIKSREVTLGLARAVSKTLGLEECYIEKEFNLESGFDVAAMNVYPPCFLSNSPIGLPAHYDPGYLVLLIQNVNGGLQLNHNGKWINVNMPPNTIFVNIGDHLEILTNGKYKSPMHRVILNNKVRRISMPTAHGPSLDTFVIPAPEFVSESHPPAYRGMSYKDSLEANNYDEIDGKSCIAQLRL